MTDGYVNSFWAERYSAHAKVGWLREPQCLWPGNYEAALEAVDQFDTILTYYQPLLDARPDKFRFAPYGGIWLPRNTWGIKPKTKNISMLIGSKQSTDGHRLRHEIYQALQSSGLAEQVDFYGVYGTPVDYGWQTKYKVLADYRYTIVTETCYQDNLFTEILLDPLMLGTIPIFWGCPNLADFFNPNGAWTFEDVDELIGALKIMDETDLVGMYHDSLYAVYSNMLRAEQYEITEDWLWQHVLKELV